MNKTELRKAMKWFLRKLKLTDWTVTLSMATQPPKWVRKKGSMGEINMFNCTKEAAIWVNPKKDPLTFLDTVFHEVAHLLIYDAHFADDHHPHLEDLCYRIADLGCVAYRKERLE